jgi:hypothetical protein
MTASPALRKFTALDILNRAAEYGMVVSLVGDSLAIDVPPDLLDTTKFKAMEVIKANKPEIMAYLRSLESPALCCTCLDDNHGREANHEYESIMYCDVHYILKTQGRIA